MFRIPGMLIENSWVPTTIDNEVIQRRAYEIMHIYKKDFYGDLCCLIFENPQYIQMIIFNTYLKIPVLSFVIAPDYHWTWKEEEDFLMLLQEKEGYIGYDIAQFKDIYQRYSSLHPEWNLHFEIKYPFQFFDHIRHCMQPGSAKEKLYKAGLFELAANIDEIEEYNMIGSTPTEIFSGLNMRTLRVLNSSSGIMLISTEEKRRRLLCLQEGYSWMYEREWNPATCLYINELLSRFEDEKIISNKFRIHCKQLQSLETVEQYEDYMEEVKMRDVISEIIGKKLCKRIDSDDLQDICDILIEEYDYWNSAITESNKGRRGDLEYCDDTYCLSYPKTIKDFVIEAIAQNNCLLDYLDEYIDGTTDILFLRNVRNMEKSFITVEIRDGIVEQASLKCNEMPIGEVVDWLNAYADERQLQMGKNFVD